MPGVLDAYLDVLRCAHCRSPKVEAQAVQLTRGSKFCLCRACGGEFRVSAKKWTKYERRAQALAEAVAADAARLYPADQDGRVRHIHKLEKWIAHLGIGSQAA
ncbi:MAG: hypothetical protein NDI82_13980 [Anaeromyxobacteraceae bacterium]|nr:hypothetical protein [Anaeromyxobacteraceae bacterium]